MRTGPVAMRICATAILGLVAASPSHADLGLKYVESNDLQVMNFDPSGASSPLCGPVLLNALAAQNARFGYAPDGKVAVLLQDFADRATRWC